MAKRSLSDQTCQRERSYVAYKVTNLVNGKAYIGITTRGLRRRWKEHREPHRSLKVSRLSASIKKYGVGSFTIEHIASATNIPDLLATEATLIVQHNTLMPHGYNLCSFSDGVWIGSEITRQRMAAVGRASFSGKNLTFAGQKHTVESRAKIAATHRGMKRSAATVARITAALLARGPRSPEASAKISAARTGMPLSAAHRASLRVAHLGRKHTAQARANMSASAKRKAPASDEARLKLSVALKGRKKPDGFGQRLSERMMGRTVPLEVRAKIAATLRAKSNPGQTVLL
jgi:group I intron endonuclease